MTSSTVPGYEIRPLTPEEFRVHWKKHSAAIFDDAQIIFRPFDWASEEERVKARELDKLMGTPLKIYLGAFRGEEFAGWSWGFQESAGTFYMCNSAVLPEHRRQGLYTALLNEMLRRALGAGFQKIYSRHTATNNAVIIPKLKAGFHLTHFELSDNFGVLVHLSYFPSALRRKILEFRAGDLRPDAEMKKALGLT